MAYLTREDIPFHYALADAFTICDAYHCSFIGSTDPNRYYMWTGYTGNDGKGGGPVLGNDEAGYDWTTYPERLEAAGVSWKIYQDVGDGLDANGSWGWIPDAYRGNYGDNSLLYFNQYRNAKPSDPLYDKARTGTDARKGEGFFDQLKADVKGKKLPKISWASRPRPSPSAQLARELRCLVHRQVLDALTSNPEVWAKTALFITYDENDGFFDHLVAVPAPVGRAGHSTVDVGPDLYKGDAGRAAGPYGLGQRVPMLVVSPWSKGGSVCSETLDHTSIIRFIEHRSACTSPTSRPGGVRSAVTSPPPSTSRARTPSRSRCRTPTATSRRTTTGTPTMCRPRPRRPVLPRQERSSRSRPLKYAPLVDGSADAAAGKFTLTFGSGAKAGAAFFITSGNRTDGPWTYTTEAGKTVSDTWNSAYSGGSYDLTVHGPNGFLRVFKGPGRTAGPEVTAHHVGANVELTFTDQGVRHGRAQAHQRLRRAAEFVQGAGGRDRAAHGGPAGEPTLVRPDRRVHGGRGFLRRFAGACRERSRGCERPRRSSPSDGYLGSGQFPANSR